MILIMISIVLDTYVLFGPVIVLPFSSVVLGVIFFLFTIVYVIFTVWLANKTCYNFIWVSWLIVLYLVYSIVESLETIINPLKREKIQKEIDVILKEMASESASQQSSSQ
jgi:cobalamin biosynthesis protein CobD/CbiB